MCVLSQYEPVNIKLFIEAEAYYLVHRGSDYSDVLLEETSFTVSVCVCVYVKTLILKPQHLIIMDPRV